MWTNLKNLIIKRGRLIAYLIITALFIFCGLFFKNSYKRIIESLIDVGLSLASCFSDKVSATVNNLSSVSLQDLGLLPKDFELFKIKLSLYGKMLINPQTLTDYGGSLAHITYSIACILLFVVPIIVVLFIVVRILSSIPNNDYNSDTAVLSFVKRIARKIYHPTKNFIQKYIIDDFFKYIFKNKAYYIPWLIIWALNLNLVTIALEVIAYYFYFCSTFDLIHIYIQAYKLLLDLSIIITLVPAYVWVIVAIIVFCIWRRWHSFKLLDKLEEADEEYAKSLPISTLVCGAMGTKKTTFLTDIAITINKIFRDVAQDKLIENDMRFPYFPWINLELCIKKGIETHHIYNLATCSKFIKILKICNDRADVSPNLIPTFKNLLKRRYGYAFDNFIFDYDVERYGMYSDDHLERRDLFDVLDTYAKLYFIYIVSGSLLYSNYSIRVDDELKDKKNFPLWESEFFHQSTAESSKNSHYSHVLDYDALRLGTLVLEDNRFKDSLDFGIIVITEIGKERGNQYTVKAHKLLSDKLGIEANQDNDSFNIDVKMCRHRSTVDNFPFVFYALDENRQASLGADFAELCDVVYISESSDFKIITPLYSLDELIYIGINKLFNKYYLNERYYHGNNTLTKHIIKTLYNIFYKHHLFIYNTFSVSKLTLSIQDGINNKQRASKYKLSKKKIHACRFSTDAWGAYYAYKTAKSEVGIMDVPEFKSKRATLDEIASEHSYFDIDCRQTIAKDSADKF
jgi:uncharacterized protein YggT (Ycf19 family)